jgi:hypothetical protein
MASLLRLFASQKGPDFAIIKKIIAELYRRSIFAAKKDRHQLIILRHQRIIGINVDHLDGESVFTTKRLQRLKHVVAKMAVAARIKNEMCQGSGEAS